MNLIGKVSILMSAAALLGACATMTKEQCLEANASSWEHIGYVDGGDGQDPEGRLELHRDACKEVRVLPDRNSYMVGWKNGLVNYCTPEKAYEVGRNGYSSNSRFCPPQIRDLFEDNVDLGRRVYNLRMELNSLESEINGYENKLSDKKLSNEARRDLHAKIRNRDRELSHLRMLLREAEAEPLIRF